MAGFKMDVMHCFFNGKFIPEAQANLGLGDLAILRGYGIFDFFRLVGDKPLFLDHHLQRFIRSAQKAHLELDYSLEDLKEIIFQLLAKNRIPGSAIRMVLTGGYSENKYSIAAPNFFIRQERFSFPEARLYESGIKLISYPHSRELSEIKSINYLTGIWLEKQIRKEKAFDVLYHHNGFLTELTRSNVFIVNADRELVTPNQNMLHGITRQHVIELAKVYFPVWERNITLDELYQAKEAFITGTTKRLLPIRQVDQAVIGDGIPGPVTHQLMVAFSELESTVPS